MIRLGIRVRAADAEIAFAQLEPVLAAGVEEIDLDEEDAVEFAVYGDSLPSDETLRALAGDTIVSLVRSPVDSGWARAWQDHLAPVTIGAFTIRPPWIEGDPSDLVIDPGPSFGAASHPTTRLCLEILQSLEVRGALVDWGTGSGVLAIAAARLGYTPVVAVELDVFAAHVAKRNAGRNGALVEVSVGDVTVDAPWAPTIVANLTLPLLLAAAGAAAAASLGAASPSAAAPSSTAAPLAAAPSSTAAPLAAAPSSTAAPLAAAPSSAAAPLAAAPSPAAAPLPSGPVRLIASGVLATQAHLAAAAWARLGFVERERRVLEGWAALVLERDA